MGTLGATTLEVRRPHDLASVDGMVIPGGESTAISILLGSSGLLAPLRARLADGMPAFGTCAGMILLASEVIDGRRGQAPMGALDITVRRNAFGRQVDSFETDLDVAGLEGPPSPLHAVFIRAPVVERIGPDIEVLAELIDPGGRRRPVVCRAGPVLVAAFHPELSGDTRLHRLFVDMVIECRRGLFAGPVPA
ncbi:MAG: pyridoxal 5'-phosphate synthase glutaminase subunit PdxT [Pseudonocardiaceae bacterium]